MLLKSNYQNNKKYNSEIYSIHTNQTSKQKKKIRWR